MLCCAFPCSLLPRTNVATRIAALSSHSPFAPAQLLLLVALSKQHCVRRLSSSTQAIITRVAGCPSPALDIAVSDCTSNQPTPYPPPIRSPRLSRARTSTRLSCDSAISTLPSPRKAPRQPTTIAARSAQHPWRQWNMARAM